MSEYSFTIHEIKGYISSLYLIETAMGFLLLDGGCASDFARLKNYLERNGRRIEDIKLIVVTHMHPDHAGTVRHFKKENIPVASTEGAYRWYRGVGGFIQHKIDTFLAWFSAKRKSQNFESVWYSRVFTPDYVLKDGDTLPIFPDWRILFTPGHTLYDISLFNEKEGVLYPADLVLRLEDKFVLPFPVLFPSRMIASLEKIKKLTFKTVLLAHGGIIGKDRVDEFKDVLERLIKELKMGWRPRFKFLYPFCLFVHDKWR